MDEIARSLIPRERRDLMPIYSAVGCFVTSIQRRAFTRVLMEVAGPTAARYIAPASTGGQVGDEPTATELEDKFNQKAS
jgi:hypothetical protein